MKIRDRIKELRRVRAAELVPHPQNWRTHPQAQQNALRGILAEVGYADALLVRELADGSLQLIDGHLRAETTPDAMVPVLVLDVNEEEATKLLLTHDPITALAEADRAQLDRLISETQFTSTELQSMLSRLQQEQDALLETAPAERPEVAIPESYQVVVECASVDEQETLYHRMKQEGYRCRVLTL